LFEDIERYRLGVAYSLKGCVPLNSFKLLGKVVGRYKSKHMGLEAIEIGIVEALDGGP
jgi:hypothetical protein